MIFSDIWDAGNYHLDIFVNDTLWKTLNLTVVHDYHEELGPPSGYTFNNGTSGSGDIEDDAGGSLRGLVIFLLASAALVWMARRKGDE